MTGKVFDGNSTGILILILPLAVGIVILYKAWFIVLAILGLIIAWKLWENYQWKQWSEQMNPFFRQLLQENQGCLTTVDLSLKTNISGNAAKRFLERKAQEYGAYRRDYEGKTPVYYFVTASTLGNIFDQSDPPQEVESLPVSDRPEMSSASASPQTNTLSKLVEVHEERQQAEATEETPASSSNPLSQLAQLKEERNQTPSATTESEIETEPEEISEADSNAQRSEKIPLSLIQSELAKRLDLNSSTVGRRKSDPDFAQWSQSKDPDGIAWKYLQDTKLFIPLD